MRKLAGYLLLLLLSTLLLPGCLDVTSDSVSGGTTGDLGVGSNAGSGVEPCRDGLAADSYSCSNVDLVANLQPAELLGDRLNDIWGWTDPQTGKEFAIVGLTDGVTFVDISEPDQPVVLGKLEEATASINAIAAPGSALHDDGEEREKSSWRDFKVYDNHLFVVSDGQPHGMQVFDLTRLRQVSDPPVTFSHDVHYNEFGNAHNIAINEETGFAYAVGSNTFGGGLHIINVQQPLNPTFAGFHQDSSVGLSAPGYVHDTQCVRYRGPDDKYTGRELCFNSGESHLVIADVTRKDSTVTIGKATYSGAEYIHQGWLTEDHRYFLVNDELDELRNNHRTTTYIFDVSDLEDPVLTGSYVSDLATIDHNFYVNGSYLYQSNYTAGLRILDTGNIANGKLTEVAHFDTYPLDDQERFAGAWSNYPFFESGLVIVSDTNNGLFILRPTLE